MQMKCGDTSVCELHYGHLLPITYREQIQQFQQATREGRQFDREYGNGKLYHQVDFGKLALGGIGDTDCVNVMLEKQEGSQE